MFFQLAVLRNVWLWFHLLGGAVLAKMGLWLGAEDQKAFLIVFSVQIVWEIGEFLYHSIRGWGRSPYGLDNLKPAQHFFIDAFGDTIGALVAAVTVLV